MFSALKKLFGKPTPVEPVPHLTVLPAPAHAKAKVTESSKPTETPQLPLPSSPPVAADTEESLVVPLSSIIQRVPRELYGKLAPAGVAGINYTISRSKALEQLARGAVKVPFGELRKLAPSGVFVAGESHDHQLIELPLPFIIKQLKPEELALRPDRQRLEAPTDIGDLFGTKGEHNTEIRVLKKSEALKSSASSTAQAPQLRQPQATPTLATRPSATMTTKGPSIPAAKTWAPPPNPPGLGGPNQNPTVVAAEQLAANLVSLSGVQATAPGSSSTPARLPNAGRASLICSPDAKADVSGSAPQRSKGNSVPASSGAAQLFLVALEEIAVNWPEAIRQEIAQLKIPFVKCGFPPPDICEGLKRGKIEYAWGQVRSRIFPHPPTGVSPHADVLLDFPLSILTPLFLDFIRSTSDSAKPVDSDHITEFFRKGGNTDLLRKKMGEQTPQPPVPPPAPATPVSAKSNLPQTPAQPVPDSAALAQLQSAIAAQPPPIVASAVPPTKPGVVSLPLSLVSGSWPDALQKEIARLELKSARLEMPFAAIEPALKAGKIEFLWSQICPWLNPCPAEALVSPQGDTKLSMPLNVVAPLFLQQRPKVSMTKAAEVPVDIPDLFNSAEMGVPTNATSQAETPIPPDAPTPTLAQPGPVASSGTTVVFRAPVPLTAGHDTAVSGTGTSKPTAVSPSGAPAAPGAPKRPANLAELFGEPDKRKWTPNDVVSHTVKLPGVAGALIALQDGLMVASSMPAAMRGETISAFLPQIMGRMGYYAKEFGMGGLKSVSLTVEQGTLCVFNPGPIYFAVLGRKGECFSLETIEFIADELSRRSK